MKKKMKEVAWETWKKKGRPGKKWKNWNIPVHTKMTRRNKESKYMMKDISWHSSDGASIA